MFSFLGFLTALPERVRTVTQYIICITITVQFWGGCYPFLHQRDQVLVALFYHHTRRIE